MITNDLLETFNKIKEKVFKLKKYTPQGEDVEGILISEKGVRIATSTYVSGHGHGEGNTYHYDFFITWDELEKPDDYHFKNIEKAKKEQEERALVYQEKIKQKELLELKRLKYKYENSSIETKV